MGSKTSRIATLNPTRHIVHASYSEFCQQNIENIAQFRAAFCLNRADFYNDYAEFRLQNIAEYRVTFCINDRDEYLCYMQQLGLRRHHCANVENFNQK